MVFRAYARLMFGSYGRIELHDGPQLLGRGEVTGIDDAQCSRKQVEVTVDSEARRVIAKRLGINVSRIQVSEDAESVEMQAREEYELVDNSVLSLVLSKYRFKIEIHDTEKLKEATSALTSPFSVTSKATTTTVTPPPTPPPPHHSDSLVVLDGPPRENISVEPPTPAPMSEIPRIEIIHATGEQSVASDVSNHHSPRTTPPVVVVGEAREGGEAREEVVGAAKGEENPKSGGAGSTAAGEVPDTRPLCRYGAACYRTNPQHRLDFRHEDIPVAEHTHMESENPTEKPSDRTTHRPARAAEESAEKSARTVDLRMNTVERAAPTEIHQLEVPLPSDGQRDVDVMSHSNFGSDLGSNAGDASPPSSPKSVRGRICFACENSNATHFCDLCDCELCGGCLSHLTGPGRLHVKGGHKALALIMCVACQERAADVHCLECSVDLCTPCDRDPNGLARLHTKHGHRSAPLTEFVRLGARINKRVCQEGESDTTQPKRSKHHHEQQQQQQQQVPIVVSTAVPKSPKLPTPFGAPGLLLANKYDPKGRTSVLGWWMSEKFDGMRAYYDGKSGIVSRLGKKVYVPSWFTAGFPQMDLDGELWKGRGKFQETMSIVRKQNPDHRWKEVKFLVFDSPSLPGTFEQRIATIKAAIASANLPHLVFVTHTRVDSMAQMDAELERVLGEKGEGLMLRKPQSLYEGKRSSTLLKVKKMDDDEAQVIAHEGGGGRHAGRCGALRCQLRSGKDFKIGTGLTDKERDQPPPIGSIVEFTYQGLTNDGVPRFPAFQRVRPDITQWP